MKFYYNINRITIITKSMHCIQYVDAQHIKTVDMQGTVITFFICPSLREAFFMSSTVHSLKSYCTNCTSSTTNGYTTSALHIGTRIRI